MRRSLVEEEDNAERWMVSYADFITLLFGFFVVMYAISSVNDEKYRVLSATLQEAFAVDAASTDPIPVGEPALAASPHVVDLPDSNAHADMQEGDTFITDPVPEAASLLGGFADLEGASVHSNQDWLELNIDAGVLFEAGSAQLSSRAADTLSEAVTLLQSSDNPVTIEGYTDNVPSSSRLYPSNWELSSARASAVARYFGQQGIRAERLAAVGYGENHPLSTNATPDGRAANRRVVVVIARRAGQSRNLNAAEQATAVVRSVAEPPLAPAPVRTESGGLLFSADAVPGG